MKVLHLSDTPLSGAPIRLSQFLNKYTTGVESRHICWVDKVGYRLYDMDMLGCAMPKEELHYWVNEWADIHHFHNRYLRQEIFKSIDYKKKPGLIQIHSPRESENFREEILSKLPIACVAQYHPRQWPERKYIVPNVIDILSPLYRKDPVEASDMPIISYAPSNTNGTGWNQKSYGHVAPVLKRMRLRGEIHYALINQKPFYEVMVAKREAHIGIDEITTGSYHLSTLEYLSLGVACFAGTDSLTDGYVKEVCGAETLPWIKATHGNFERILRNLIRDKSYVERGRASREWMEKYWAPERLRENYVNIYKAL